MKTKKNLYAIRLIKKYFNSEPFDSQLLLDIILQQQDMAYPILESITNITNIPQTNLDTSPESRACPRATQQGCTKCGGTWSTVLTQEKITIKKMDWMDFNFQHNFNDRNIVGQIFEKSKSRIGKNFMTNRLSTINWKIGYT